jgi:two-component system, chemotaxis family, response regulator Rcp1
MNVLLIEDNEGDVVLIETAFKQGNSSTTVSVTHNGVEAIEYLSRQGKYADAVRPDLVLLDLNMPRMGGHQFLKIVKQDEKLKSIPIVVLTSSRAPKDIRDCYELHANCYILKPFDLEKFMDMIKQVEEFWGNLAQLQQV